MSLIANLEGLLKTGKDDGMLRFGLGNAYFQQKDYAKAIEHLTIAVRHDPEYSAAWKLLGKAQSKTGQVEEAIATFRRGIDAAGKRGDKQAVKEMQVFLKRLTKQQKDGAG